MIKRLTRIVKATDTVIGHIATALHSIGGLILAVLMVFTFVDVVLRYFFSSPIKGDYEISAFMMAIIIPAGLALTARRGQHIRVDVITERLPERVQAALSSFAYLVALILTTFMAWQAAAYAHVVRASGARATTISLSHWPFVAILTVCLIILWLVFFRQMIRSIYYTIHRQEKEETDVTG